MKSTSAGLLTLSVLLAPAACRERQTPAAQKAPASPRRFTLRGFVRKVDAARFEVTVEHEAIPGYMAAMTMPFPVREDPQVVELLRPGDRLEATLIISGDRYWLEKILTGGFVPTVVASAAVPSAGGAGAPGATPQPNRAVGVGEPVPDFALTDQTGKMVRLSEMRGEPLALTFLYTQCPVSTACPMTTAKFSRLDAMLKEKNFGRLLVVTVDPRRDTPKALAEYAKKAGADPRRWKFLTGDAKSIADVATNFGVLYYLQGAQIVHTQAVAVVDRDGRLATIYYGDDWQPEYLLRDLEKARKG